MNFYILAAGFTTLAALAPVALHAQSPKQLEQLEAESNQDSVPLGFPVRILEEPAQSEDAKRQQEETAQREAENLITQQAIAKASKAMIWLNALQVLIAALGTLALIYSLKLNRIATHAAAKSAESAAEALGFERAWLTPGEKEYGPYTGYWNGERIRRGMAFRPIFSNTGRIPASKCSVWIEAFVVDRDAPIPDFTPPHQPDIEGGAIVAVGGGLGQQWVMNDTDYVAFENGAKDVVLFSGAFYQDIFSGETWRKSVESVRAVHQRGTKMTPHGPLPEVLFRPQGVLNYTE